jgi:hypothetical protein
VLRCLATIEVMVSADAVNFAVCHAAALRLWDCER